MHDPRRDRMKADALFGTLSRQGARHRCQAAFRQVGETGGEARDRLADQRGGDRNDMAELLQTHLRNSKLRDREESHEIRPDRVTKVLRRIVTEWLRKK